MIYLNVGCYEELCCAPSDWRLTGKCKNSISILLSYFLDCDSEYYYFFFNSPVFRTEVRLAIQSLWESNNICRFKVFGSWKSILSPALYPPSSPLCSALYKGIARFPGYRPCTAPLFLRWCLLPMSYLFILGGECLALGPYKAWEIIWSIPDKVLGVS